MKFHLGVQHKLENFARKQATSCKIICIYPIRAHSIYRWIIKMTSFILGVTSLMLIKNFFDCMKTKLWITLRSGFHLDWHLPLGYILYLVGRFHKNPSKHVKPYSLVSQRTLVETKKAMKDTLTGKFNLSYLSSQKCRTESNLIRLDYVSCWHSRTCWRCQNNCMWK